ncbi:four helix bundle protein [Bacteroides sp. OttesenSCG-928-N06]|nr:four helix bundle protein [Bacteroides sp. OttesenSCG-928-N06]
MQDYRKLSVWGKAHELTLFTYKITAGYPREEIYALVQQMRRAASSIPMNIAEGCGRNSNLDVAHFLNIAIGSANEVDYQYLLSKDLSYISTQEYETVTLKIREIRAMLISLANRIRQQNSILNTHNS